MTEKEYIDMIEKVRRHIEIRGGTMSFDKIKELLDKLIASHPGYLVEDFAKDMHDLIECIHIN